MMEQTGRNFKPKMKLRILVVLIVLGIVEGTPKLDSENQDLVNHLFDFNTETVNHKKQAATDLTSQSDVDYLLQESETENHEHTSEDGLLLQSETVHQLASDSENTNDNQAGLESTNQGEEVLTNDDKPDQEKHKPHWWSRHKDSDSSISEEEEAKAELAKNKVAAKVNHIVRKQVLKKASEYAGEDVDDSDEHPLVNKVASLARDAAIRRLAPMMFRKTLHSGINFIKSKVDNIDSSHGTLTTRDVDLFNQRRFARELGFKAADRVANTLSMVLGGAVAEGTLRKFHKTSNDEVAEAVEDLGEENLVHLAQEINEEEHQNKHSKHKKGKHDKEKDHEKYKHKSAKHNKDKHHKKDKETETKEQEDKNGAEEVTNYEEKDHHEEMKETHEENDEHEGEEEIEREEDINTHGNEGKKHKHEKKQKHEKKKKHEKEKKHEEKEKHEKKSKHGKKEKHEKENSKHGKHHEDKKHHKDSSHESEENIE